MDKRRSILNVSVSIFSRIILLAAAVFVRRLLIQRIGNEVNGLNSLYASIIGMLKVAELGVGSAIVFSMYKPITAKDDRQVAALYCLYKKLYMVIGTMIFAAGVLVMPFLPFLISDCEKINVNVYATFFLTLVSVVLTYVYGAKTSLIEAHKDNYITTIIMAVSRLAGYFLQTAAILIYESYTVFLICNIIETLFIWGLTEIAVKHRHGNIITLNESVDSQTKSEIVRNIKAMFMHKIGAILVNSVDGTIISIFVGVAVLGKYSNYALTANVLSGTIALFFSSLTSVVGHLCASEDTERIRKYFDKFYSLNYFLGFIFFLGYYVTVDRVIALFFGEGLEVSSSVSFVITVNQFTQYMRGTALLFRNASGTFYYDRWKPLAEGVINLILSLIFVNIFPESYRVAGVIAATIATTLLICDIVEPYVVFRHVFNASPLKFCIKNYICISVFVFSLLTVTWLLKNSNL